MIDRRWTPLNKKPPPEIAPAGQKASWRKKASFFPLHFSSTSTHVGHELFADRADLLVERGREHHHLLVVRGELEDLLDVGAHLDVVEDLNVFFVFCFFCFWRKVREGKKKCVRKRERGKKGRCS